MTKKKLPWDFKKVSWVAPFPTTKEITFFVTNSAKLISIILIALIGDKLEQCQCGTKLSIYVKNEKINIPKKYTKIFWVYMI